DGIPVIPRAQMLAELCRFKKTLAVAGSHGKTTTTSMAAAALEAAGARPTMIVGGRLKNVLPAAGLGLGDYMVVEADESDGSFVHLAPLAAVVTNIDDDHLDFHKSMDGLKRSFLDYLHRLPFYGCAVICRDDEGAASILSRVERPVVTYGLHRKADWRARGMRLAGSGSRFEVLKAGRRIAEVALKVPGRHNVLNALAALAAGAYLGFDPRDLARGLEEFLGVGRRLDRLGSAAGVEFVDDYGHHPTEIAATLSALAVGAGSGRASRKKLVVIFQPHRFSRTQLLSERFGPAFRGADFVYVTDIYPAGEKPLPGVSSKLILDSLARSGVACAPFAGAAPLLRELGSGDTLLTLGAGDVRKIGEELLLRLGSVRAGRS
ncbi:MAG: UDP-N-acetylmuramate--L-alanine ligase, partial [Elusimicrobia bacterium]|nr:UDP-N-acetylmuramate--L-alanine ligase [Elusimicrobiota bacterium]